MSSMVFIIPNSQPHNLEVNVNRRASNSNDTIEVVVLAADRLGSARVATNTNNAKRRAGEADKDSEIAQNHSKETEEETDCARASRLDAIAALQATGIALTSRGSGGGWRSTNGDGGRDGFGRSNGNSGGFSDRSSNWLSDSGRASYHRGYSDGMALRCGRINGGIGGWATAGHRSCKSSKGDIDVGEGSNAREHCKRVRGFVR